MRHKLADGISLDGFPRRNCQKNCAADSKDAMEISTFEMGEQSSRDEKKLVGIDKFLISFYNHVIGMQYHHHAKRKGKEKEI